jgi:DNA-binding transcriptional MerR regulator
MSDDVRYSLTELADLAGVTPRTVRYYMSSGLLPGVGQTGPGAKYDNDHLGRLRLIRRLQRDHLPLAEIRQRLAGLDDDDVRGLAEAADSPPPADTALDYIRTVLGTPRSMTARPAMFASPLMASGPAPASQPAQTSIAESVGEYSGPTAPAVERSQWERVVLAPDVELHVRRPLSRTQNKKVDRLVTIARELLEED